jgi:hypothetical protein
MKNNLTLIVLFLVLVSLNSCYVNRTTVGNGPVGKAESVRYSHKKQLYVLWGLMALKHAQPETPIECGYQIKTSFNAVDAIVSVLTGGIFSMRTVKVLVFKDSPCDPKIQRQERKVEQQQHKIDKEEMHQGR